MAVKHPGFNAVAGGIAKEYEKKGISKKKALAIGRGAAANAARGASKTAKKKNPNLKRVKS
jgi:hypothetical protein